MLLKSRLARKLQSLIGHLPFGVIFSNFFDAMKTYEDSKHLMIKGFLISIGIHMCVLTMFILISHTLGGMGGVRISEFFFLVPFGLLVTAIPIAPAGLGTGHAAFLGLFQLVHSNAGADLFTAFVSFQIFISLIGGLFYLKYRSETSLDIAQS
jgi:uncharacterized membrane protein YbhN (UPF0104 family)